MFYIVEPRIPRYGAGHSGGALVVGITTPGRVMLR